MMTSHYSISAQPGDLAFGSVSARTFADLPNSSRTTAIVAVNGSYDGELERRGDRDWIRVDLVAGETYTISLAGTGASSGLDTVLRVYAPGARSRSSGTLVASNDDVDTARGDYSSAVTFTAAQSGTYFIEASAYSSRATGSYQVSVTTGSAPQNGETWSLSEIATYLTETYWGGDRQTFDIPTGGTITVDLTELGATYREFARTALQSWAEATGLTFEEVSSGAQISFISTPNDGAWSSSSRSGGYVVSSVINVEPNWASDAYTLQTFIHEIGHSLGLGHAGPYNGSATFGQDNLYANDSWQATIMSYFHQEENSHVDASFTYLLTPMPADVVAIRSLYGSTAATRTGDSIYGYDSDLGGIFSETVLDARGSTPYALTIVDDGGIDAINLAGSSAANLIDLRSGTFSNTGGLTGNLAIAPGVVIENAFGGSGADRLIGNDADNLLSGGGGSDTIDGGAGIDTALFDGSFEEWTITGTVAALIVTRGGETDSLVNVEYLRFEDLTYEVGTVPADSVAPTVSNFSPADDATNVPVGSLIAISFSEAIARGAGSIELRIGSPAGELVERFDIATSPRLTLSGATLTIDPTAILANETAYVVTIEAGALLDLAGNPFAGTSGYGFTTEAAGTVITGSNRSDSLTGSDGVDLISGLGGNDILTGAGGVDRLDGGEGSDIYLIASADEHGASEFADSGTSGIDEVRFTTRTAEVLRLHVGDSGIERIVIGTGTRSTAVVTAANNAGIDASALGQAIELIGNAGANLLIGGTGDDRLTGNRGADFFQITAGIDTITDLGAGGQDQFHVAAGAAATISLAASWVATAATLNLGDAHLTTNGYGVDLSAADAGTEGSRGFMVTNSGRAAQLVGSALADHLVGGTGADRISGGDGDDLLSGGAGRDILVGGRGSDLFIFDVLPGARREQDSILDFVSGEDRLYFSSEMFAGLAPFASGPLAEEAFHSAPGATRAQDASDRIIFNSQTGDLYYDPDGVGGMWAVHLAVFGGAQAPALTASDIMIG